MAAQAWPESTPLIRDMLERGHEFSFPQVMRLARACLGPDALERNRVRVHPLLSLAFPAADVDRVERDADGGLLGMGRVPVETHQEALRMPVNWEAVGQYVDFVQARAAANPLE